MAARSLKNERKGTPLVEVGAIRPMHDFWGNRLRRYIPGAALSRGIHATLSKSHGGLCESLRQVRRGTRDSATIRSVTATLFQEGEYQYVFKVAVKRPAGRGITLGLIVAKNDGAASRLAGLEYQNLILLHRRHREYVARPLSCDAVSILPPGGSREKRLFCYFTVWLHRFHEIGVLDTMNFFINEIPFHSYTKPQTDHIKGEILRILFSSYDPIARKAVEPPKLGAGDFVITRPQGDEPLQLRLIACRKILEGVSVDTCLRLYLGYHGAWGERIFHFLPGNLAILQRAIVDGLMIYNNIKAGAISTALHRYADDLSRQSGHEREWSPLPFIKRLLSRTDWLTVPRAGKKNTASSKAPASEYRKVPHR